MKKKCRVLKLKKTGEKKRVGNGATVWNRHGRPLSVSHVPVENIVFFFVGFVSIENLI